MSQETPAREDINTEAPHFIPVPIPATDVRDLRMPMAGSFDRYGAIGIFPSSTLISEPLRLGDSVAGVFYRQWADEARMLDLDIRLGQLKKDYAQAVQAKAEAEERVTVATIEAESYAAAVKAKEELDRKVTELTGELTKTQSLKHIADKVETKAQELLFSSKEFANLFTTKDLRNTFVLSADLRRSTTLMLKARNPELFARFLYDLCDRLYNAVLDNHGVFDKFTGDGILAFYPEFYSGEDAGYLALKTASTCHEIFNDEYRKHRHCFSSVLSDVGLGIGIDWGPVHLVNLWGGLTIVGTPVVYACRMGNAPAGKTLLNQPAYELTQEKYKAFCTFKETELEVKGEGRTVAYETELDATAYKPPPPDWPALIRTFSGPLK